MSQRLVIDTSAYVAILAQEPDADRFVATLRSHSDRLLSAATYVECAMVSARWQAGRAELDAWLSRERIDVVAAELTLAQQAADAFVRFGKGRHPAGLNFGDCFSYALAKSLNAPLLFKGNDFSKTDVTPALP